MPGIFDDLMTVEEESLEKILITLLDEENVEMKTEIQKPLTLARLNTLGTWLKDEGKNKSSKSISIFIKQYLIYMVSNKRQSRKEIIQALTDALKQERTLTDKLITTSKPEG